MEHSSESQHVNVGTGVDMTIRQLAEEIRSIVNPDSTSVWDSTKPDGTPRKLLEVSRLAALGWRPSIGLTNGLTDTYQWFVAQTAAAAAVRGVEDA